MRTGRSEGSSRARNTRASGASTATGSASTSPTTTIPTAPGSPAKAAMTMRSWTGSSPTHARSSPATPRIYKNFVAAGSGSGSVGLQALDGGRGAEAILGFRRGARLAQIGRPQLNPEERGLSAVLADQQQRRPRGIQIRPFHGSEYRATALKFDVKSLNAP